ncbi:MAG TPA: relaxase/mobilization nuclease domain-containing protein [Puia sp.]|nr:relaxase/mobilization nuclease domain-containing protein [Puia sp.]
MRTMIFKILKSSGNFHGIDYNEKKVAQQAAGHLYHENFGYLQNTDKINKVDFQNYLVKYSSSNARVKKPQFHATLSAKGKEHSFEELKEAALQIMYELGYRGNPILIYSHSDTENNHIHIISSRVDLNGKKIRDNKEGIKAVAILNKILGIDHDIELNAALGFAQSYSCATLPQFAWLVESKGFKAVRANDGYSFHKSGKKIGSLPFDQIKLETKTSIGNKKRINQIRAIIHKYKKEYSSGPPLRETLFTDRRKSSNDFTYYLKNHLNIEFAFFKGSHGKTYGYSIIDHREKIVFKGSDIMKMEKLFEVQSVKNEDQPLQKKWNNADHELLLQRENLPGLNNQEESAGIFVESELAGTHSAEPDLLRKKKKKRKRLHL